MYWGKYFNNIKNELPLITLVSSFYLIHVIVYTADDFKVGSPPYLVAMGIIFHSLVALILIDEKRRIKVLGFRRQIEKVIPFGLMVTYGMRYYLESPDKLNSGWVVLFLVTAVPVIGYLFLVIYKIRWFVFLLDQRRIYNHGYILLYALVYLWVKYSN
ncbi:MAG: hypothetical protein HOP30_15145 [Cyclobacteriaceae bacterium]|nr:hypothetical protein [Cyclobacteriaceae bacterium]